MHPTVLQIRQPIKLKNSFLLPRYIEQVSARIRTHREFSGLQEIGVVLAQLVSYLRDLDYPSTLQPLEVREKAPL